MAGVRDGGRDNDGGLVTAAPSDGNQCSVTANKPNQPA